MVTKAVVDQTLRGGTDPTLVPMSKRRHGIITISILVATYLVSISTKCLGIALELNVSIYFKIFKYFKLHIFLRLIDNIAKVNLLIVIIKINMIVK